MWMWCSVIDLTMTLLWKRLAGLLTGPSEKDSFYTGEPVNGMLRTLPKLIWYARSMALLSPLPSSQSIIFLSEIRFNLIIGIFLSPRSLGQLCGLLWQVEFLPESTIMVFLREVDLIRILSWKYLWQNTLMKRQKIKHWKPWMLLRVLLKS